MNKRQWKGLLKSLTIDESMGKLKPVNLKKIALFEKKTKTKLPKSYKNFCEIFGAGEIGRQFKIAVPGYKGIANSYSLEYLDSKMAHEGLEYKLYSKNQEQHERGIFFCIDIVRSYHFFDPSEVTTESGDEYAVYTLFSDFKVRRTADDFWQFVSDYCLGANHKKLIKSPPAQHLFMPVSV